MYECDSSSIKPHCFFCCQQECLEGLLVGWFGCFFFLLKWRFLFWINFHMVYKDKCSIVIPYSKLQSLTWVIWKDCHMSESIWLCPQRSQHWTVIFQSVQNFNRKNTWQHCIYSQYLEQSKWFNFLAVSTSSHLLHKLDVNVPSVLRNVGSFILSSTSSWVSQGL